MPLLGRDAILAADDRAYEDVPVPEWGGTVRVATVSAAAIERIRGKLGKDDGTLRASFLSAALVDENGAPLFTADDVEALAGKNNAVIAKLHDIANRLNNLDVEAAEKN